MATQQDSQRKIKGRMGFIEKEEDFFVLPTNSCVRDLISNDLRFL